MRAHGEEWMRHMGVEEASRVVYGVASGGDVERGNDMEGMGARRTLDTNEGRKT